MIQYKDNNYYSKSNNDEAQFGLRKNHSWFSYLAHASPRQKFVCRPAPNSTCWVAVPLPAVTHGVFPMETMDRTCCFYDLSYQEKTQIWHYVVTAGVNRLIDMCLRVWQQNICCHTVVTSFSRPQFVYFQLVMLKVWQRDGVTIKKQTLERSLFSFSCSFICCAQKYNKGVGWRNKDVSWQPYCIFRRNKDIGGGSR